MWKSGMGVRWQACWTVTTGDTVDWYEYDRCLRGFSYPLRKPATADCARSPGTVGRPAAACRPRARPDRSTDRAAVSTTSTTPRPHASQPRRARQLLDTLLRTARSDEASTSKALTAPRQFLGSGSGLVARGCETRSDKLFDSSNAGHSFTFSRGRAAFRCVSHIEGERPEP